MITTVTKTTTTKTLMIIMMIMPESNFLIGKKYEVIEIEQNVFK